MPLNIAVDASPVSGYRLLGMLGEGGYGQVWEAEAPGGMRVAMKFIRMDTGQADPELRALDAIRNVRHPHLLDLHFTLQVENYLVIASSLCDMNLFDRFQECRNEGLPGIPPEELWRYMEESATAIDFLNEQRHIDENGQKVSIQHRDIKPLNLFLVGGSIKVADFGLAKVISERTSKETDAMTPQYTAPERMDGRISSSSDQYSLAVSYCELRTGTFPFDGSVYEIIYGHMNSEPNLAALPIGEQIVVHRALSKNPNDRWESCREFVKHLKQPPHTEVDTDSTFNVSSETVSGWSLQQKNSSNELKDDSKSDSSDSQPKPKSRRSSKRRKKRKSRLTSFLILTWVFMLFAAAGVAYVVTGRSDVTIALVDPPAGIEHIELDAQEITIKELGNLARLKPGSHHLQITGTGFEEINQEFTIQRGEKLDINVEFVTIEELAEVNIRPPTTNTQTNPKGSMSEPVPVVLKPAVFTFTVTPPSAEISILKSGASVQRNGAERIVTVPIREDDSETKLVLSAKMNGYEPLEHTLVANAGQTDKIDIKLVPLPAVFKFLVTPTEATVKQEGLAGQVDGSGKFVQVKVLRPDGVTPVVVSATLRGYEPAQLKFVPKPGESGQKELKLKAMLATLQVTVTPANATVRFESERVRMLGGGAKRTLTVADSDRLGNVKIIASLTGYAPSEFSWSIKPGEKLSHQFDLLPSPAILNVTVQPVSAKLTTTPSNAKISLVGKDRKIVVDRPDRIKTVKVLAKAEGYEPLEFDWQPTVGSKSQKVISLVPKPVTLTMILKPADAELRITPQGASISGKGATRTLVAKPLSGPYKIEAGLRGYETAVLTWKPEINVSKEHRFNLMLIKPEKPSPLVVPFNAKVARLAQQQWAAYAQSEVTSTNSIGVSFVLIPPGKFTIGLPADAKRRANAIVAQAVQVDHAFSLSTTEVTQTQWFQMMKTKPWSKVSLETGDDYPAVYISWNDAQKFCRKLTEMEASKNSKESDVLYRLPTEIEWEWACRAGSNGKYTCPEADIEQHAWFAYTTGEGNIHPVAKLAANQFGLHDMHGNASEWCNDIFTPEKINFSTPASNTTKNILRGGSWNRTNTYIQSTARGSFSQNKGFTGSGFRIVKTK